MQGNSAAAKNQTVGRRHPKVVAYYQGLRWGIRLSPMLRAFAEAEMMMLSAAAGDIDAESSLYRLLGPVTGFDCLPELLHWVRQGEPNIAIDTIDLLVAAAWQEDQALRRPTWKFAAGAAAKK
jgi:hypothetical protein